MIRRADAVIIGILLVISVSYIVVGDYYTNLVIPLSAYFPGNVYWNVTKEIIIPVQSLRLAGVNPPQSQIIEGANVYSYDKAQNESAYGVMHVIPEYKEGSNWHVVFYWAPDDATAGNVAWCINATRMSYDTSTLSGEASFSTCMIDAAAGTQYGLQRTTQLNFEGFGTEEDDIFSFEVFRGADSPQDTYNADVHLVLATIYYVSDKAGET